MSILGVVLYYAVLVHLVGWTTATILFFIILVLDLVYLALWSQGNYLKR
jgi:hypothetical protein